MSSIEKKIFSNIVEKGREFVFPIKPKSFIHKIAMSFGLCKKAHKIYVKPMKVGTRIACSSYFNKIDIDKYKNHNLNRGAHEIASNELDNIILFLATIIWNDWRTPPPEWIIKGIKEYDQNQLDDLIAFSVDSIGAKDFIYSITWIQQVSLQTEEIIASEKESPVSTK